MIGTTLSHYRIVEELGRGGMGIVYKAEDTKLDRTVAIKVLPSAALASKDDRERFYREAKAAAALNHPHIAQVYEIDEAVPEGSGQDDSRPFIAMEFIDGGTLEDRIKQSPLKLKDAIGICIQVADALKSAHSREIVHRDVKSANVMLTPDGNAKVLDFGLAQTAASTKLTRMGSTLGTVAYMSPEQARGEAVDSRTDLYSLGAVLYEMIAGHPPFAGEYEQALVYNILNAEPEPLTALRSGVPMELERITNKLLAKDAGRRYQSGADLIVDLESVPADSAATRSTSFSTIGPVPVAAAHGETTTRRSVWGMVAAALVIGLCLGAVGLSLLNPRSNTPHLQRVDIILPDIVEVNFPKLSPDGQWLAFRGADIRTQQRGLFLRDMASGEIRYLESTESGGLWEYGFSPSGDRLAFTDRLNDGVFTVSIPNGIPERHSEYGRFAFWKDESTIIVNNDRSGGGEIFELALPSGEMTLVEVDEVDSGEGVGNVLKTVIPGSDRAFGHQLVRTQAGGVTGEHSLFTTDLGSGEITIIEANAINPEYVAGGYVAYQLRDDFGKLVVRPVNKGSGIFSGRPIDALDATQDTEWRMFSVSSNGDLMTVEAELGNDFEPRLWLIDLVSKSSEQLAISLPENSWIAGPVFSPDARSIAFTIRTARGGNVFLYDRNERLQYQITFDDLSSNPVFGPDGQFIYFANRRDDKRSTLRLPLDARPGTEPEVVVEGLFIHDISSDSRWLIGANRGIDGVNQGISLIERSTQSIVWSDTTRAGRASFSPDDEFVAYSVVDGSGQLQGVVRHRSGAARLDVPSLDKARPVWPDGGDRLYIEKEGGVEALPARTSPTFNILGEAQSIASFRFNSGWHVSKDGRSMTISSPEIGNENTQQTSTRILWYQNWSAHLGREFGK